MTAYRIEVRSGGQTGRLLSQGSGFALRSDALGTAYHVIGKPERRRLFHEGFEAVSYWAMGETGDVLEMRPVLGDFQADVAILSPKEGRLSGQASVVGMGRATKDEAWTCRGYPRFMEGRQFTLSGRLTDVRADKSNNALQLLVAQDTRGNQEGSGVPWEGMSGSAVRNAAGDVLGVLTQITEGVATGWGASGDAVLRLLSLRDAKEALDGLCELLARLYPRPEPLLQQRIELGWPGDAQGMEGGARGIAQRLIDRAALDGLSGIEALLREVQRDFPTLPEVTQVVVTLTSRLGAAKRGGGVSRQELIDQTLSELIGSKNYGVALLGPLGFGARGLADEVLQRLDHSDRTLLPIRLVPERSTTTEEELYGPLLADLKTGLEAQLGAPLPPHWREPLENRREPEARLRLQGAIEGLLRPDGPALRDQRRLVLAIDGLARVQTEQLRRWSFLLAKFAQKGLRLLVWGGKELSDLRSVATDEFSALHVLHGVEVGALTEAEVIGQSAKRGVAEAQAKHLHEQTGGHPALVEELLAKYVEEVEGGDGQVLRDLLLTGDHMHALRTIVEREPVLQERLRERVSLGSGSTAKPKPSLDARLYWLGILRKNRAKFEWLSPVMSAFAQEWL